MGLEFLSGMSIGLTTYDGCHPLKRYTSDIELGEEETCHEFEGSKWSVAADFEPVESNPDALDIRITFRLDEGSLSGANASISFAFKDWSPDNYVLIPAAAYNGNRFKSIKTNYPPMLTKEHGIGPEMETIITDVPRLNYDMGPSRIQLLAGDTSTPAVGLYMPGENKGFFVMTRHKTPLGYTGITLEENEDRSWATVTMSAPGVRHDTKYVNNNSSAPGDDIPCDFHEGDRLELTLRVYCFQCAGIPELFSYFFNIRKDLFTSRLVDTIPFSYAMKAVEDKHNKYHWDEEHGLYRITINDAPNGYWQAGWVGGGINTYPLLLDGSNLSRERAYVTLNTIIGKLQAPSGFFYAMAYKGKPMGDNKNDPHDTSWSLIRKQADILYFMTMQCIMLEKLDRFQPLPHQFRESIKKAADALVRLWNKWGQFGQFVDIHKGEILIGGTASGAMAPGALALAYEYLGDEDYLRVASEAAMYYYDQYLSKGLLNGGPGDIAQCPDSESAFALLESYVVLYEVTKDRKWIGMAEDAAKHCATWCVSYDFEFSKTSEFARLGIRTTGTVYANVQNKHSAPGICTLSGVSLFKLYRATGNRKYLELIRDIAHNITQFLSTKERPVRDYKGEDRPPGYMCERVNMSDWEGKGMLGMVFLSTWPEVSTMLTYSDIPGVYIQKDTGFVCALDNIDVKVVEKTPEYLKIQLKNNTAFPADVKLFIESSNDMDNVLGVCPLYGCGRIQLKPNSSEQMTIY